MDRPDYTVAVRTLCEFAAKGGDLDLRFTPSPTAQQGIAGHRTVAAGRGDGYRTEVAVSGRYRHLCVRGRADGFDAATATVDEIKTFRGSLDRMPANHRRLHWAQAKVYAYLIAVERRLATVNVSLVYFDVGAQREDPPLRERCDVAALRDTFEALCERFIAWADREIAHRAGRDATLASLRFPYPAFRRGQRPLAEAVYKATRRGACLMAEAPTGIGKTLGTLFPLLKAAPSERLDKIFFLTAKGTGRRLAIDALAALAPPGDAVAQPRVLELTARDKACEHPDRQCHGESCPLARGFYDRLDAARSACADAASLDRASLRRIALAHDVCPYYLAQEMVRWCDVVIGDYNHFFDANAGLFAATEANEWRVAVLVDEAHNLVERARAMYSAELRSNELDALAVATFAVPAQLKAPLDRVRRAWRRLADAQETPYAVQTKCPRDLAVAMQDAVAAMADVLFDDPAPADPALLGFYFALLRFTRLLETFDDHSILDVAITDLDGRSRHPASTLCIRNVVPAPFLKPRFAGTVTTVLFSATLAPRAFYADTLGVPADALAIEVDAPFAAEQLAVRVVRSISTRYRDRPASLGPIAALIADRYRRRPGNYLAFFSSFDYLDRVADAFDDLQTGTPTWRQARRMDEAGREAFLASFVEDGCGVGFAVLGGAFGEGVDLVGSRLVGAFIATLGLPQVNPVNEELRRRLDDHFGAGYDYTYLYPGIRKVTQAAGRVIRTLSDRGSVDLIDDRFARPEVARLLPRWWRIDARPSTTDQPDEEVEALPA